VKMSNGPSKDVVFQIAHTAGLPNHAAWLFLFFPHLGGPPSRRDLRCSRHRCAQYCTDDVGLTDAVSADVAGRMVLSQG
jgi:hypothetical protein